MPELPTDEVPEELEERTDASDKADPSTEKKKADRSYYYDDAYGYSDYDPGVDEDESDEAGEDPDCHRQDP